MSTTVKIPRGTLLALEKIREELKSRSLDKAIKTLIRRYPTQALNEAIGVDGGRIRPFTEKDRAKTAELVIGSYAWVEVFLGSDKGAKVKHRRVQ